MSRVLQVLIMSDENKSCEIKAMVLGYQTVEIGEIISSVH